MDYEKRYNKLIDAIKDMMEANPHDEGLQNWVLDNVPELTESEDEKIRKEIKRAIDVALDYSYFDKETANNCLAWLEKQCESKVSEPNWCHHKVDLSDCSEEYRKAYYDGWNNCNIQHSQCNEERNDVVKCLINGMKFYYEDNEDATWGTDKWSMPVKHIIEVLERQGEKPQGKSALEAAKEEKVDNRNCATVEPKFKVGDWIIHQGTENIYQVVAVIDNQYQLRYGDNYTIQKCDEVDRNARLWNISDAKGGDLLYIKYNKYEYKYEWIIIFKHLNPEEHIMDYCSYCINGTFYSDSNPWGKLSETDTVYPATKEQCDLLFSKIKENGYWWNAKNKILKKIES